MAVPFASAGWAPCLSITRMGLSITELKLVTKLPAFALSFTGFSKLRVFPFNMGITQGSYLKGSQRALVLSLYGAPPPLEAP
eukprot:6212046-Pleurochrysis_carterae.AAC.4